MKHKAWMVAAVYVVVMGMVGTWLVRRCMHQEVEELPMEETMSSIEAIRMRGELYVCSALMEDYAIQRATERDMLWVPKEHSCVQTMRQKCSYKIDMDKVEYLPVDSTKTIYVKLPPVTYVASTQSTSFLSDDSNYWAEHLPNTNGLKKKVEGQIRARFDTPDNRKKAERYAEEAIREVLKKLGYETEFVRSLEKVKG